MSTSWTLCNKMSLCLKYRDTETHMVMETDLIDSKTHKNEKKFYVYFGNIVKFYRFSNDVKTLVRLYG